MSACGATLGRPCGDLEATLGRLSGGLEVAREVLAKEFSDARVIVAAADLLDVVGASQEGSDALDRAWLEMPGNGIIRRARLQRSLSVEP